MPGSEAMANAVKIATLENDLQHLTKAVERLSGQVETLTSLLERSRGALLVFTVAAGLVGFMASKLAMLVSWTALIPR